MMIAHQQHNADAEADEDAAAATFSPSSSSIMLMPGLMHENVECTDIDNPPHCNHAILISSSIEAAAEPVRDEKEEVVTVAASKEVNEDEFVQAVLAADAEELVRGASNEVSSNSSVSQTMTKVCDDGDIKNGVPYSLV